MVSDAKQRQLSWSDFNGPLTKILHDKLQPRSKSLWFWYKHLSFHPSNYSIKHQRTKVGDNLGKCKKKACLKALS